MGHLRFFDRRALRGAQQIALRFEPGLIFVNIVLADELNLICWVRSPTDASHQLSEVSDRCPIAAGQIQYRIRHDHA